MAHPRDLLQTLGASPLKHLSQNFLTSPHWADRLTDATLADPSAREIWEIGPGLGALTEKLLQKTERPILVFELDRKLAEYLRQSHPRLKVIEGDVCHADFPSRARAAERIAILSNLPYHLSSPLLFKFVEIHDRIARLVLTFQKEFADRLSAKPRTKDYGALTLLCQLYFEVQNLGILPPGAFYPPPSVASQALLLLPLPVPERAAIATSLIKAAFSHRRKKLASNLKAAYPETPWEEAIGKLGFSPSVRAEELTLQDYLALSERVAIERNDPLC